MQNPRLASRYAKSLLDLAVERNSVDVVLKDIQLLDATCRASRDFELMLRSPVIKGDKKEAIINAAFKDTLSPLTKAFIGLMINKGRESNMPEIAEAFIAQYNEMKNIRTVRLTTAAPVSEQVKNNILGKIGGYMEGSSINLKTNIDESLIGGFVLETEGKLFDASVKKKLNDMKSNIVDSSYVAKMN